MEFKFIDYVDEQRPDWTDEQFRWMAVCEEITARWYFMLTMDEYVQLYKLKYPEADRQTIRDAYVFQIYSELDYRGEEEFSDLKKRDTKLIPIEDENGMEYLVNNQVEKKEELLDKVFALHANKTMYIPTVQEMEEYFEIGCNPSKEAILDAIAALSELVDFKNSVYDPNHRPKFNEDGKPLKADGTVDEAMEKELTNRDMLAQGAVCSTIRGLENGLDIKKICEKILKEMPFKNEAEVTEQLIIVYNNTRVPGNKGHTPLEMK